MLRVGETPWSFQQQDGVGRCCSQSFRPCAGVMRHLWRAGGQVPEAVGGTVSALGHTCCLAPRFDPPRERARFLSTESAALLSVANHPCLLTLPALNSAVCCHLVSLLFHPHLPPSSLPPAFLKGVIVCQPSTRC